MRIICGNLFHVGEVAIQFSRNSANVSADEFSDFTITFTVFVIISYTTAFFYAKMRVVHTDPPWEFCCGKLILPEIRMNCFYFFTGVALESIVHQSKKNRTRYHRCDFIRYCKVILSMSLYQFYEISIC